MTNARRSINWGPVMGLAIAVLSACSVGAFIYVALFQWVLPKR